MKLACHPETTENIQFWKSGKEKERMKGFSISSPVKGNLYGLLSRCVSKFSIFLMGIHDQKHPWLARTLCK